MRRLVLVAWLAILVAPLAPARADVPVLDPERGVVTMAPLLEKTTPAVVNIAVETRRPGADNPLLRDPFFRRFFDLPEPRPRRGVSAGSGVIVDAERGWILTNHHVVANAERVVVTLRDGRELAAELRGSDPDTDIALLGVEATGLTDIPFADSDRLEVGDLVVAIGNPSGLGQTVTSGIVSALGRSGIGAGRYEDFIQTDAPINPGNSGGALVDTKGELVGIDTAILAPSGGNVGIGFAVPENMARAVMDQLIRYGEVRRGRIGVAIQDLTPALARGLGVEVRGVAPCSPAWRFGLRAGDVILGVNRERVRDLDDLRAHGRRGERVVALDIVRDGRRLRLARP